MNWYVIHVQNNQAENLIEFFRGKNIIAFIPKIEKWYSFGNGKKEYILKDLMTNSVFVKTELDKDSLNDIYMNFFISSNSFISLVGFEDIYKLNIVQKSALNQLLNNSDIVKHSVGNIINKKLKCDEGPLVGLEDRIIKVDRHHRLATLSLDNMNIKVPVEVVKRINTDDIGRN